LAKVVARIGGKATQASPQLVNEAEKSGPATPWSRVYF
jgi:hypothetical protein